MKGTLIAALLGLTASGCVTPPATTQEPNAGIDAPNVYFVDINRGVVRCGQPTPEGFRELISIGIVHCLKLNEWSEGQDIVPAGCLFYHPITLAQQIGTSPLPQSYLDQCVAYLATHIGTVVHCGSTARTKSQVSKALNDQGGQDRTGLVVAMYRVRVMGWTKAEAEKEMLALGFHKELLGLWHCWENFK